MYTHIDPKSALNQFAMRPQSNDMSWNITRKRCDDNDNNTTTTAAANHYDNGTVSAANQNSISEKLLSGANE